MAQSQSDVTISHANPLPEKFTVYNPFSPESAALAALLKIGYVGRKIAEQPDAPPDSIVYKRELKVDIVDWVQVFGPNECVALRIVGTGNVVLRTYGTVSQVVARILFTWPEMPTAGGGVSV